MSHPLKVRKTKTGWAVEYDPDRYYTGNRVKQRYLYSVNTLATLGIDYSDAPYSSGNEHGTSNVNILWERARPDKVLSKGFIVQ